MKSELVLLTVHSIKGVDQSYVFTDPSAGRSAVTALQHSLDPSVTVDLSGVVLMDDSFQVLHRYTAVIRVGPDEIECTDVIVGQPFLADPDTNVNEVTITVATADAHTRSFVLRGNSAEAVSAAAEQLSAQLSADLRT